MDEVLDLEGFENEFNEDFFNQSLPAEESERPPDDCLKCLKERFGHSNFRPLQWKVISSIMNDRKDNCIVMSTGYGKSLCYQFPSVFLDTCTVIISPLIALMEDQVLSLTVSNIKACLLGTAQRDKAVLGDVFAFKYNLIFVSPEFVTGELGTNLLKNLKEQLTLIAIDEAHCISKWGHDFRPAFRNLSFLRTLLSDVPILTMTATATEQVRNDIIKSLHLRNPQILCSGFDRPNLEFHVRMKGNQGVWADIGTILKSIKTGSIIVYCITRADTEEIAEVIQSNGINCAAYHAGLSLKQRKLVHENFVKDLTQVIVATIAFGMGIDKPDIRMVIHYGVSKDIESYYQEVGRAGRDGLPAKCIMFWSRKDFKVLENIRANSHVSICVQDHLENLSKKIKDYVNISECRRSFLLEYFEGTATNNRATQKRTNCCDNCKNNLSNNDLTKKWEDLDDNGLYDFTNDAEMLMLAIKAFKGFTGITKPILLLRGSTDQKLPQKLYSHTLYGKGKSKTEEWYKSLADLLERNDYLEKHLIQPNRFAKKKFNTYGISVSEKGNKWLNMSQKSPIKLKPQVEMYRYLKKTKSKFLQETGFLSSSAEGGVKQVTQLNMLPKKNVDPVADLVKGLLRVRSSLSSSLDVMPYMIASNKALYQMAHKKPLNLDEMRAAAFDGFSDTKISKFGPAFIKCILQSMSFLPVDNLENFSGQSNKSNKENITNINETTIVNNDVSNHHPSSNFALNKPVEKVEHFEPAKSSSESSIDKLCLQALTELENEGEKEVSNIPKKLPISEKEKVDESNIHTSGEYDTIDDTIHHHHHEGSQTEEKKQETTELQPQSKVTFKRKINNRQYIQYDNSSSSSSEDEEKKPIPRNVPSFLISSNSSRAGSQNQLKKKKSNNIFT